MILFVFIWNHEKLQCYEGYDRNGTLECGFYKPMVLSLSLSGVNFGHDV